MAFFDNIKFPFFTMQELNLDWLLKEVKRIAGFMPQDGNVGDVLTRKSDGAEWEPPDAVNININALPEDTVITDNDQLVFYDISASANRKIKPPNLIDSMMSNGTPLMDGTASPGTSKKPARYDHKHPTDTSRQAALSGTQMDAVNSGAPANCFTAGGVLKFAHGGLNDSGAGYCRMPDGTLIQWGRKTGISFNNEANVEVSVTMPYAFIDTNYDVIITPTTTGVLNYLFRLGAFPSTTDTFLFDLVSGDGSPITITGRSVSWLAVGRWKA